MPIYEYNGERYNLPDDVVSEFVKDFPAARLVEEPKKEEPKVEQPQVEEPYVSIGAYRPSFAPKVEDTPVPMRPEGRADRIQREEEERDAFSRAGANISLELGRVPFHTVDADAVAERLRQSRETAPEVTFGFREQPFTYKSQAERAAKQRMQNVKAQDDARDYIAETMGIKKDDITDIAEYTQEGGAYYADFARAEEKRMNKELDDALTKQGDALYQQVGASLQEKMNKINPYTDITKNFLLGIGTTQWGAPQNRSSYMPGIDDEQTAVAYAAARALSLAKGMQEAAHDDGMWGNFWEGALSGLTEAGENMTDAKKMNDAIATVVKKWEEGGETTKLLNDDEKMLLDALAYQTAVASMYQDEISSSYNVGNIVGAMGPWMVEFVVNPASGLGRKAASQFGKYALKRFAKNTANKYARSAIYNTGRGLGRIGGSVAGGAAMTATTGLPKTVVGIQERMLGRPDVNYAYGKPIYAGQIDREAFMPAVRKEVTKQILEYGTEMLGAGYFDDMLTGVNKLFKGTKWQNWIGRITSGHRAQSVKKFMGRAGWNGPVEEFLEEVHVGLLEPYLVGDNTHENFFNKDNLIEVALGVTIPGVAVSTVRTVVGAADGSFRAGAQERWKMDRADRRATELWGNWAEWKDLRNSLMVSQPEEIEEKLKEIANSTRLTDEQKMAAIDFGIYSLQYRTARGVADAMTEGRRKEINSMLHELYYSRETERESGYSAQPDEMSSVQDVYEDERARVLETLGEDVVSRLDEDPIGALADMNEYDVVEASAYVNAKARRDGMMQRVRDNIGERVAESNKEIDMHVNKQDGMIHPAMMRGATPKRVYIVNGNVATFEDGTIDKANSSSMIIVRDAETGEVSAASVDDLESLEAVIDTEAEKKTVAEQIASQYAMEQAGIIDGELPFNVGDVYKLENYDATVISVDNDNVTLDINGQQVVDTKANINAQAKAARLAALREARNNVQTPMAIPTEKVGKEAAEVAAPSTVEAEMPEAAPVVNEVAPKTALEQIPRDENGVPLYEQVDSELAWDGVVEEAGGNEETAMVAVNSMIADKQDALKKAEKAKAKAGATITEKIAAENERVANIERAKADLAKWQEIAGVKAKREAAQAENVAVPVVEETQAPVVERAPVEDNTPQSQNGGENARTPGNEQVTAPVEGVTPTAEEVAPAVESAPIAETPQATNEMQEADLELAEPVTAETRQKRVEEYLDKDLMDVSQRVYGVEYTMYDVLPDDVVIYRSNNQYDGRYLYIIAARSEDKAASVVAIQTENGDWTLKLGSKNKEIFKELMSKVLSKLPQGARIFEEMDVTPDGLRVFAQQLKHGFTTSVDTYETYLGKAKYSEAKDDYTFSKRKIKVNEGLSKLDEVRSEIAQQLDALGVPETAVTIGQSDIRGFAPVKLTLPYLVKQTPSSVSSLEFANSTTSEVVSPIVEAPQATNKMQEAELATAAEPVGNSEQLSSSEFPNNQSVAEADAPGQSGVEEIQEPRSVEEVLENGDKRITNYNSRGEVATVATERDGKVVSVDSYDEGVLFEHTEYDGNGVSTSVTRYDKQGNVIGTQEFVDGKAVPSMPSMVELNRLPKDSPAANDWFNRFNDYLNTLGAKDLKLIEDSIKEIEGWKNQKTRNQAHLNRLIDAMTTRKKQIEQQADAGPVNMETLQLNMSEEDFNALLDSGDKDAISEYLAELDGALRIDENSPFAGQVALREVYRKAVEQYGKENIPAEVMDDLNSRMQPYSDLSRAIFDRKYALQDKLREIEASEAQEKELAEKEAKAEHKQTAFGGFLAGKSDVGASTAEKALDKRYKFDDGVQTVAEYIEQQLENGTLKIETREEPKYKGVSRQAWNRMDARQQAAEEKRVKEGGMKTVYSVNNMDLGKTAYDYAKFLLDKKAELEKASQGERSKGKTESESKQKVEKIEDVGKKIGGARKDIIRQYADKIKLDGKTFSTMFPKPDIDKLVEAGLPKDKVATVKAMYDNAKREFEITKKRRGKDKALQASLFYAMYAKNVLTGEEGNFDLAYNGFVFTEWGKEFMKANIALYKAVFNKLGTDYGKVDLRSYFITPLAAGMRENFNLKKLNEENSRMQQRMAEMDGRKVPEYKDGDVINFVGEHYSRPSDQFETLEEAVNTMVERISKEVKVDETAQYKVESYWKRDAQGRADYTKAYLGIKVRGFGTVDVMEFKNMNEANTWLQNHREDFQQMAAAKEEQVKAENKKPLPKYVIGNSYDSAKSQYSVFADFGKEGVKILKTFDIPQAEGVAAQAKARSEVYKNDVLPYMNSEEALSLANGFAQEIRDEKSAKQKPVTVEKKSRERVGVDWRNGKDATPEMFVDVEGKEPSVFGFRAIEFGNYVSQKERQQFLNDIYDALMDMSEILGVSPRALSLGGKLALAVGARGTSGASGHYEPYKNVINITKTRGAGVLAHEWLHAFDRYFSNFDENAVYPNGVMYATQGMFADDTRREVKEAFDKVMTAIKGSDYEKRSMRLGEYWASDKELAARALQDYIIRKLDDRGQKNDFLSNHVAPEEWDGDAKGYPFPLGEDAKRIADAFDNLFATLEEKTTEEGDVVLYRSSEDEDVPRLNKHRVEKNFGGIWIEDEQEFAKFASAVRNYAFEEDGEGIAYTDNYFYAYYLNIDGKAIPFASVYLNSLESQNVVNQVRQEIEDGRKEKRAKEYFDTAVERYELLKSQNNANTGDNRSSSNRRGNVRLGDSLLQKGRYYYRPDLFVKTRRVDRFGFTAEELEERQRQAELSKRQKAKANEVLNALKEAGYNKFHIVSSITEYGVSTYIVGDMFTPYQDIKLRISDHAVTSERRQESEFFYDFETPVSEIADRAIKAAAIVDKKAKDAEAFAAKAKERNSATTEKWERIKDFFDGLAFYKTERTSQNFEEFSKDPKKSNILQTDLGNGMYRYEYTMPATAYGVKKPSAAYIEAFDEEIGEVRTSKLREGAGPLTDREVVMESDLYSKVLGKPRYYGKRQREFVARQRRRMAEKARQVAEKLNLDNVEVLERTEGLTGKKATSKGWFDPRTGKITVVVPNHGSIDDIVETVLHEAVAHYGLRKLFGKNFKNFLDNVYNNVTPEIRAEITELAKKHGWDFHTATEEYLASLAENTNFEKVNPSVWRNIKSFFMKMLAKVGITLDKPLGDNELRYILWRSHQNLVNPGWFNVFGQAEDIAKQYELGVGNYASGEVKTESGDVAEEDDSALLHREGGAPGSAREEYERNVRRPNESGSVKARENFARRAQEAYHDSMLALKILQDAVARETGNEVKDNENAYIAENRMSSSNKAMVEIYERDFFMPLMDEINALIKEGVEYDDIIRYLHAKHGLERNEYMRRKQAEEAARRELGEEPAMPNEGDADYEAKVNAKAAWRANLAELTESYVKKFAKRDYSGLTALTESANAKDAEAAAQQMVDEFENDHDTTPLWEAVNKATKETLRREFVGGLIDRATYDTVSTMFDFYIPLRGWDENVAANEYEYFTNNNTPVFTPAIKTMNGRKSLSDDPIATIGYMAGSAIARANRNLMKQKFLNFVMNNPTSLATVSEQWYTMDYGTNEWRPDNPAIPEDATPEQVVAIVEAHEANMRAMEKAGFATRERGGLKIGLHATKQEQQQHVVRVMRNGKEYAVYINGNPRAAQALNGMTNPDSSLSKEWTRALAVKNFMARAFTSRNPAFIVTNLSRDVIWAGTAVAAKEDAEYTKQYTKNVTGVLVKFKLPRLLRKFQNGTLDMNNEVERYFDEFLRNGGETGFTQVLAVEDYKKNIKRFTKEAKNGTRISKKAWRGFWNGIEFLNRSAEDITRFTVYMTSRQMGRSIARSVYDAKEVTVNFNKKGSGEMGAKYWNFAYIFFNATIQSLANFGKLMARHPGKMAAALGTFGMMGFLMPVINAALMALGDDDDEENYWNLPEWVRRNNIVLFVPWTEKGFITIPLPHEIRPFYGMGENAMSALLGKQTTEDAIKKSLVGFTGMLPIDFTANGGDVVVNVMPTILQPFAQVRANVTHFGTPIYKDNDFNKKYPSWTKAYKGTNSSLVAATKWLNELGGGNNVESGGLLDWNPAVIEHLFESYLGGMGKTFNKMATTVSMIWDEDARIARNIPVASSFYQESDERTAGSQLNREYFDALAEMEDVAYRLSGYRKEITRGNAEYEKMINDLVNSDEFMRYGIIKDYSNTISELNQVLKNNNPAEEEAQEIEGVIQELKKEMLDELEKLQAEE